MLEVNCNFTTNSQLRLVIEAFNNGLCTANLAFVVNNNSTVHIFALWMIDDNSRSWISSSRYRQTISQILNMMLSYHRWSVLCSTSTENLV